MIYFFYRIGIYLYYAAVFLASFFNEKARLWIAGRKGWAKRMKEELEGAGPLVWIHCASLGEFEQGRPLIEKWKENFSDTKILLTFFSPSGYEVRKDYQGADFIFYLPLDTPRNAKRFFKLAKPKYAIFVKYEFWQSFLRQAGKTGTKLFLISAIFRQDQLFFKSYGRWYRKILSFFSHIFVQDDNSVQLLSQFPNLSVSLAGDTRFDRVVQIAGQQKNLPVAENFVAGRFCFVLGSTWEKDEDILLRYIDEDTSDACYILAPHEIGAQHIQQLTSRLGEKALRYSEAEGKKLQDYQVLLIDNMGMLSALYRYGKVAYIGGGFGSGIHNILEPAVYNIPVIFGPRHEKFREAVALVKEGGAFPIDNYEGLRKHFNKLQSDSKTLEVVSTATKNFIQQNLGATDTILDYLKKA